jgi:hypothetical protein
VFKLKVIKTKSKESSLQRVGRFRSTASRKRKLIFLGVYLLVIIGLIINTSLPSHYLTSKAYTNEKAGISIKYPKGWLYKEGDPSNGGVVSFVSDKQNTTQIDVSQDTTTLDLTAYVKSVNDQIKAADSSYLTADEFDTTVNGQKAHVIDGGANDDKGVFQRGRVMVIVKNGQVYIVSASANSVNWDSNNKFLINASMMSFEITK